MTLKVYIIFFFLSFETIVTSNKHYENDLWTVLCHKRFRLNFFEKKNKFLKRTEKFGLSSLIVHMKCKSETTFGNCALIL